MFEQHEIQEACEVLRRKRPNGVEAASIKPLEQSKSKPNYFTNSTAKSPRRLSAARRRQTEKRNRSVK